MLIMKGCHRCPHLSSGPQTKVTHRSQPRFRYLLPGSPNIARLSLKHVLFPLVRAPAPVQAERYFIKAGIPLEAVDMYSRAGKWDAAQKVARGYLSDSEMRSFYRKKGRDFEAEKKWKEAEKAYIQVCCVFDGMGWPLLQHACKSQVGGGCVFLCESCAWRCTCAWGGEGNMHWGHVFIPRQRSDELPGLCSWT